MNIFQLQLNILNDTLLLQGMIDTFERAINLSAIKTRKVQD